MTKSFFKRLNFFKGMFTTAEDWLAEQRYHVEKHELHHRGFHTPGVIPNLLEGLDVITTEDNHVKVRPGYAVDAEGHDLYLPETHDLRAPMIDPAKPNRYIYIKHTTQESETVPNYTNRDLSGAHFITEKPEVDWTVDEPDNKTRIELGRINNWQVGQKIIIDRNHVKYSGTRRPVSLVRSDEIDLNRTREGAGMAFDEQDTRVQIQTFKPPQMAVGTLYMANVFPIKIDGSDNAPDSRIIWRIESSLNKNSEVAYHLVLKNFGKRDVRVRFEIYRVHYGLTGGG